MLSSLLSHFAADCAPKTFFLIPSWYQYLYDAGRVKYNAISGACEVNASFIVNGKIDFSSFTLLALGVLDILLRVAGLVAVAFVVYGGIRYVTSQGQAEHTKQAQGTIVNALIGLIITILAATLVRFIGRAIGA